MEDGGSPQIGLIILLLLFVVQWMLYGFWGALGELNEGNLEKMAQEGDKKAKLLLRFLEGPVSSIHIIRFFETGLNLISGVCIYYSFRGVTRIAAFFLYWFLLLSAGIYAPSKMGAQKEEKWAFGLCRPMYVLWLAAFLFVRCLEFTADIIVQLFGGDPKANPDDVTEEEIISMVNEGHEQGVLLASEAQMIHNIFEFGDKEAKDIMTHRKNIVALDANMTFADALDFMTESGNSRFPVYMDDIDNMIGILHIKEALRLSADQKNYSRLVRDIPDLVRKVDFIPETRNINSLFKKMQNEKNHMVVVVDEYGQTSGIVAMEDILEEIVGNILDEYDEEDHLIQKQADGSFLMDGMAEFEDVASLLDISVEEEDTYETLNGYLISKIDKIPDDDDKIAVDACGYHFKALAVKNKMVERVLVTKISDEGSCQIQETMVK